MYACTVFSNDGLTVKAPYPFCHSKAISFSPSQREAVGFQFLHGFRQRQLRGQGDQQMDGVGCATCGEDFEVKFFAMPSR
jgi:hypothetical protein